MKKLKSIQEFNLENGTTKISNNQAILIHGGMGGGETNDQCHSYVDTCDNGCSDMHITRSKDGVVYHDVTTISDIDC